MINAIELENFGPLSSLKWENLDRINLIIGKNSSGKTFLLKALYSAVRTIEEYKRGNDQSTASEILHQKLYWTFQPEKIGDLVTKGSETALSFKMKFDNRDFIYAFGKDTTKSISSIENNTNVRSSNSIFLPPKEVLTLQNVILNSREQDKIFGFDDTYFDLAKALRTPTKLGKNFDEFAKSRRNLEEILEGKIEFDDVSNRWVFKKGNQKFNIGVTAEGIKKIAILDTLLGNRYLSPKSIVFIDEPESALHPFAISKLLDIIEVLAETGIQFFIASHSYFVIKKLFLIAQKKKLKIPTLSWFDDKWHYENMLDGMPDNPIVNESVRLYEEEVELVLS